MDAIKKKMQAIKQEKDAAMDKVRTYKLDIHDDAMHSGEMRSAV